MKYRSWTRADEETLIQLHKDGQHQKKIGEILDRTEQAIYYRLRHLVWHEPLKFEKKGSGRRSWTREEDHMLEEAIDSDMASEEIASLLNRSLASILARKAQFKKQELPTEEERNKLKRLVLQLLGLNEEGATQLLNVFSRIDRGEEITLKELI